MELYRTTTESGELVIEPTIVGRLLEGAIRFAIWTPVTMAGLAVFFLPEYLGEYRSEPTEGIFWLALAGMAAFVGLVGAFVRSARHDVWAIDVDRGKIVFQTQALIGQMTEASIDLDRLLAVRTEAASVGRTSSIVFELDGYPDEIVCESRFGWEPLDKILRDLKSLIDERNLNVDIQRRGHS